MRTSVTARAGIPEDLATRLDKEQITGRALDDTVDLLCYRQLHSPILTHGPLAWQPAGPRGVREPPGRLVSRALCLEQC